MSTRHTILASPLGDLTVVRDDAGLTGLYFRHHWNRPDPATFGPRDDAGLRGRRRAARASTSPASGEEFDLPLHPAGDAFQHRVWDLISRIPYGQTSTYGELARGARRRRPPRQDVGAAVGRNPLSMIVACHRVVGRTGRLTGYAGGLARKRFLLDLESGQQRRGGCPEPRREGAVRADRRRARRDGAAGLPGRARAGRRRRRLVGDVPVRAARRTRTCPRRQRRGVAGDDRAPQGDRRHPGRGPPRGPGRPTRPRPAAAPARTAATSTWPPRWPRCRPSSARPSPTTTWPACPTREIAAIIGGTADAARRAAADGIAALRTTTRRTENSDERQTDRRPSAGPAPSDSWTGCAPGWPRPRRPRACSTSPTAPSTRPVGPLLLAATDHGLVRVAFASEDHDAVLQALADRISPRVLRAPAPARPGRPRARRVLRRPPARASTCRWTGGCRPASAAPCCTTCRDIGYGQTAQLRGAGRRGRQPEGGPRGRHRLRDQPAAGRRAVPPGGPLRRHDGRLPRRPRRQARAAEPGGGVT